MEPMGRGKGKKGPSLLLALHGRERRVLSSARAHSIPYTRAYLCLGSTYMYMYLHMLVHLCFL